MSPGPVPGPKNDEARRGLAGSICRRGAGGYVLRMTGIVSGERRLDAANG